MSRQWRDPKTKGTALSKGTARGNKYLCEKPTITYKNRAIVFGNCHLALAGCTKDGIQASLPCPIFETGSTPTKAKSLLNIGKQYVDVAMDYLNQPDQWCQTFNHTYSHLLKAKQHPNPLEFIKCMLFISRDRAADMLSRACETALLELEKKELKHFNLMLRAWDNADIKKAAASLQAKEKALKDGTLSTKEEKEHLQWMENIIDKAKKRMEYFPNVKLEPLKDKPSQFEPFSPYRSTSELFNIEVGVITGTNPIAHLREHQYGWLYYAEFFKKVMNIMHGQVFKDYDGIEEAVINQLSYMESDLDIKDSGIHADKFIEKLYMMEIVLRAFPLGQCNQLDKDNRIPNAKKRRILFNACREKYNKQLEARSKLSESSFKSWAEMHDVFVDCQRAFIEEENNKKSTTPKGPPKGAERDKKCKANTEEKNEKFCQYCADNGKKDVAHTHWQSNCNKLKNDLKNAKGGGGKQNDQPWKKQKFDNSINALKKSGASKEEIIAAFDKE
ncbi:predicted protein [Chaetoceros tenuissimus]|uniref:Uncharacterized protein n=1 Tax=Chaetoceros tenuissimus TaxID=426638 RepID=A0AAD3H7J8_9STRA|nr:predicted protein [Chaetoceros tenuissimus]